MVAHAGIAEPVAVSGWSSALEELHGRIARRFARSEARERVGCYLSGLLQRVDRKNGWQLAEAIGEADPQGVQRLLGLGETDTSRSACSCMPSWSSRTSQPRGRRPRVKGGPAYRAGSPHRAGGEAAGTGYGGVRRE